MPGADPWSCLPGGYAVVTLSGELDVCTVQDSMHALTAHAARGARIVVDLAELTFIDCGSLHELMSARAQARRAGGDLVLADPQPIVLRLLSLLSATDMISQCAVFASVQDAVNGGPHALPVP